MVIYGYKVLYQGLGEYSILIGWRDVDSFSIMHGYDVILT